MEIKYVTNESFKQYGQLLEGYDFKELLSLLKELPSSPDPGFAYEASVPALEKPAVSGQIRDHFYGGLPVEVGYCLGRNYDLTFLEYHRGPEVNITVNDVVLMVAPKQKMEGNSISAEDIEVFILKAGQGVAMYETTLHSAPCCIYTDQVFRTAVVLPAGTNTAMPVIDIMNREDPLLFALNKWMIVTEDSPETANGAVVGIIGKPDMEDLYAQLGRQQL